MSRVFAFTGHRPDSLGGYSETDPMNMEVKAWMKKHITRMIEDYKDITFVVGGALGVDTWAFNIIYGLRATQFRPPRYNIKIHLYLPCVEHYAKWNEMDRLRITQQINTQADHVVWVSPNRYIGAWQMQKRNEAMVNVADGLIAIWNQDEKSGTYNCIKYARKKKVPILGYNPQTKKQFKIT